MNKIAIALGAATLLTAGFAQAQSTTTGSRTGLNMPYERGFWGHIGASAGVSRLETSCPAGFTCDERDQVYRLYGGGRFSNAIGGEIAYVNLGDFTRGGGTTDSQGLDLAFTAGFPLGSNSSIFAKLGAIYARSEVTGTAAGLATGKEDGWGPRWGLGAQIGLSQNWALRADYDRYRIKLPGTDEDVDTFTVGAQYSFR